MDESIPQVTIVTDLLDPNDYNPNRMTEAEFNELFVQVTRLGRLPKPIVVRPNGKAGRYLIVDGEHGWRAAKKAGFKTIPCELIEADDFEAMRQTYKRNQHGTHVPILLGQFFQRMMKERDLSQRALAKEIDVSEGSIRNALQYVHAASVRNDYAWEKLTVRQVRLYNFLPRAIGDLWIDTGANVKALLGCGEAEANWTIAEIEKAEREDGKKGQRCFPRWEHLAQSGLVDVLRRGPIGHNFSRLIKKLEAWQNYEWRWCRNGIDAKRLRPYTQHYFLGAWPLREARYMDEALKYLIDTNATPPAFRLSAKEFEAVLEEAKSGDDLNILLETAILNKGIAVPDWRERSSAREKLMQARSEEHTSELQSLR